MQQLWELESRVTKLESGLEIVRGRLDDRWGLVMMHLSKGNGHGHRVSWLKIAHGAVMGVVAALSLLGITLPAWVLTAIEKVGRLLH